MTDREKVIVGLECMANDGGVCHSDCPYFENITGSCVPAMSRDALELLKEQEPIPIQKREIAHMWFLCCGSCGVAITAGDRFCRMCGKAVKWE